ncbi:MAG: sigma-54-dependent Fis family transcriptional regulator [Pseudomonadales bacterium]|nr:sigma-54-dependent Fis family transcriptional regulator [Pseudomonadales bacterium]
MENARTQFQRDFYHLLLQMSSRKKDLKIILKDALKLIATISDAEQGYLEIRDEDDSCIYQSFSITDDEVKNLQTTISSGIIAEAIKTRQIILVSSALLDERFNSLKSVQMMNIEAVLCVPFFGLQTRGVLYLQGDRGFKSNAEKIKLDSELFALHVSPLLDQLLFEQEHLADKKPIHSLRKNYQLQDVIGQSPVLVETLKSAMMVAPLEVTTLLLGETGTGKNQLAKLIHQHSNRKDAPFVEINCGALPDTLIENELFGAVPGGHSSATKTITGKITAADGGTLFLDEIGDLPLDSQAKLLQFIESGNYYPLGSSKMHSSDVRLIFATNRHLPKQMEAGAFRQDLYYRINFFEITVPPLRERHVDIPLLVEQFIAECCQKNNFPAIVASPEVITMLQTSQWPGNVRELQNTVQRACIKTRLDGSATIYNKHLELNLTTTPAGNSLTEKDFQKATLQFQQQFLKDKLHATDWNVSQTAKELGLSRSHVHNLINSFQLVRTSK